MRHTRPMIADPYAARPGFLDVADGQHLYFEESGTPGGVPALFLHGGPGGTIATGGYRKRFPLAATALVGFDQRGCGRSTPHAADPSTSLAHNTTAHLIADIEAVREHLGIDRWIVNGVSWGSSLALAYAHLMTSPEHRDAASREWTLWEDTHISIGAGGLRRDPRWDDDAFRLAFCRLTTHYWSHDCFFDPPLLDRMDRVAGIPAHLIHGRRDVSGPVETAWRLHRAWPGSTLVVDEGDGHGGPSLAQHWAAANRELVDGVERAQSPSAG